MLKDITIGQYYPAKSPIHTLDPRVKLLATIIYIVTLFLSWNPVSYGIAILFLFVCIGISRVPIKFILKGLRTVIVIILISVAFNLFLTEGTVLVQFWKFRITYEGIVKSVYMTIRLMLLIMGSSMLTLTTTPNRITDGLEKSLGFLNAIRIPVHEIAMMMSIALRFIPILMDETDKIMKAQKARGADFETGNLFKKIGALVPLIVPLFVSAIRRANDLAMAMEARGYRGGNGRTKMKPLRYHRCDAIAYVILLLYLGAMIATGILWNHLGVMI